MFQCTTPPLSHENGVGPRTGPKGVLADFDRFQSRGLADKIATNLETLRIANRFSLGNPSNSKKEESDEETLETIRKRRIEQLKRVAKGRITELSGKLEFLAATENNVGSLSFIHIYNDGDDASITLNTALLEISAYLKNAQFFKIKSGLLGTSKRFTQEALPVLQIYSNDVLLGNFIRISGQLGEDFNSNDLINFLERHEIPLQKTE